MLDASNGYNLPYTGLDLSGQPNVVIGVAFAAIIFCAGVYLWRTS